MEVCPLSFLSLCPVAVPVTRAVQRTTGYPSSSSSSFQPAAYVPFNECASQAFVHIISSRQPQPSPSRSRCPRCRCATARCRKVRQRVRRPRLGPRGFHPTCRDINHLPRLFSFVRPAQLNLSRHVAFFPSLRPRDLTASRHYAPSRATSYDLVHRPLPHHRSSDYPILRQFARYLSRQAESAISRDMLDFDVIPVSGRG
jgi:hypothetical protein